MSNLSNKFPASNVTYRTLSVLTVLAITVAVVCLAIISWQGYQLVLAVDSITHHLLKN